MAFPVTLNGRTYTLADFEGTNYVDGLPDAFEDFVTHAGSIYKTTSTTSNTIGTGSKSFTTADNSLPYQVGTPLRISDGAAPATNWMDGIVTAYSGTSLTVNVVSYAGSGTLTDWDINIGGGGTSYTGTLPIAQGGTGATTAGAAATNLGLGTGDSPTFAGLTVDTNTLYVDSANNRVGIGTTSPSAKLEIPTGGIRVNSSGTDTNSKIGNFGVAGYEGYIEPYDSNAFTNIVNTVSTKGITFQTNGSERARIDSSGNLLVGKSSNDNTDGVVLKADGEGYFVRDNNSPLSANRLSTDGVIQYFFKDTSLVGSIGTGLSGGSEFGIKSSTGELQLATSYNSNTVTWDGTQLYPSSTNDLGAASFPWEDLYLTGSVYLGGTGSANALDDYEEGLHTPIIYGSTTGTGTPLPIRSTYDKLAYTKIGRLVTVQGKLETLGSHSATGALQVTLPFTAANLDDSAGIGAGTVLFYRTGQLHTNPAGIVGEGDSAVSFYENSGTGDLETILAQDMDSAIEFFLSVTYMTT
jgi:hypothetical protein